ncbi:MAG: hypothetical protein ACRD3J_12315 [Thermoanaerobaculia bacterium]
MKTSNENVFDFSSLFTLPLLSDRNVTRSRLLPLTGVFVVLVAWQIAVSLRPSLIPGPIR